MDRNSDLAEAMLRLNQSALEVRRADISSAPSLDAGLNSATSRLLAQSSPRNKSSGARFSTSYEADLWGRVSNLQDIAEWSRKITEEDLRAVRLSLLSTASINYWHLGLINQQIKVEKESIVYARYTLRMAELRYRTGVVSSQDKVEAEQSLLSQNSHLLQLEHLRRQSLNEQAVLMGMPPGNATVEPVTLSLDPLPEITRGIPADILSHRPDVQAKEMQLRQALATVDVTRKQYYPQFNLTGSLGTSSNAMLEFLRNPLGSLGAAIALPFLEWHQGSTDIKIARNDYEQRLLEFKQVQYKSMVEIDDVLSEHSQLITEEKNQRTMLKLAHHLEKLNEVRYRQGRMVMADWLNAQEQRRQAELTLYENHFNQYLNLTKMYLAFGGAA
ncbi:TolC family protein [Rahnella bruchi]